MPVISLEQLKERYENVEVRSLGDLFVWITRPVVSRSSDYDNVINDAHQKIVDSFPPAGTTQQFLFGHAVGTYAGLSRQQIKDKFGLTDANVDTIFATAGIVE